MKKLLVVTAMNALALLAYAPIASADWADRGQPPPPMTDRWERGSDWRPGIRERIGGIRRSIHNGVENGQLTRREANRARHELDSILADMNRMRSDGYLSDRERHRVLAQLDDVSRHVWRLRHNDRTARGGGY